MGVIHWSLVHMYPPQKMPAMQNLEDVVDICLTKLLKERRVVVYLRGINAHFRPPNIDKTQRSPIGYQSVCPLDI